MYLNLYQLVCLHGNEKTGSDVIKLFSCSTQLSMKFQLAIESKIL